MALPESGGRDREREREKERERKMRRERKTVDIERSESQGDVKKGREERMINEHHKCFSP